MTTIADRKKQYKAVPPEDTVKTVKQILLNKLGITLNEHFFQSDNYKFHSCRINICNDNIGAENIGTNGKGMSYYYSYASACGEFMERLQNNVLFTASNLATPYFVSKVNKTFPYYGDFLKENGLLLKYNYFSDETFNVNGKNFYADSSNIKFSAKNSPSVPFYNVFEKEVQYLLIAPIRQKCTSNGMCAGNTNKEAIIQGICEIIERYAIRLIYTKNLTPPSIPKESFAGSDIYKAIIELEIENNWEIQIKDCSCGLNLPAIGILIVDKKYNRYHFHVGADPSPITALERALTELHQGRKHIAFKNLDIEYLFNLYLNETDRYKESESTYHNSSGCYPLSVLKDKPSYAHLGFNDNYSKSDDDDLELLVDLIRRLGFTLFIRDVSYLGFPAFHIFIPGMSEIYDVKTDNPLVKYGYKAMISAHNIINENDNNASRLLNFIKRLPSDNISFLSLNANDILGRDIDLTMALLYFKLQNKKKTYYHIKRYTEKQNNQYLDILSKYKCFRDVLFMIDNNFFQHDVLCRLYSKEIVDNILNGISKNDLKSLFCLSNCFNCHLCSSIKKCGLLSQFKICKRAELLSEMHLPNQIKCRNLF